MITQADAERYRAALVRIVQAEGRVCPDFETCDHAGCNSSYAAHAIASQALAEPLTRPPAPPIDAFARYQASLPQTPMHLLGQWHGRYGQITLIQEDPDLTLHIRDESCYTLLVTLNDAAEFTHFYFASERQARRNAGILIALNGDSLRNLTQPQPEREPS